MKTPDQEQPTEMPEACATTTMGHISSKTLTQRLRVLEEMGFVQRRAFLEIPPRVEYHLTEKGQEFGEVIAAIEQFAERNLSNLAEAVAATELRTSQSTLG